MAKNETSIGILGASAGEQQRWDDPIVMVIDTGPTPGIGNNVSRIAPPPGCVTQVESWGFVLTEDVGAAVANAVVNIEAIENAVAVASFDAVDIEAYGAVAIAAGVAGALTAGAIWEFNTDGFYVNGTFISAAAGYPFAPFYQQASTGDYTCFGITVLAGGGGVTTGQLYFFLRYRFLIAPEQDFNEAGFIV